MKRNTRKYLLPAFAALAVSFASCSDWTRTESLDIHQPSLEEQNPELYARYLEALRDYKAGEHKVVFITVENTAEAPAHRNEHLTAMPDSVDYIALTNPSQVHPALCAEIAEVHRKGTRVIYGISYEQIETLWEQVLKEEEANKPAPEPAPTAEEGDGGEGEPTPEEQLEARFLAFCKEQTELQLGYCTQFGFDGVELVYNGVALPSLTAEKRAVVTARQETFFGAAAAWLKEHADKQLFFRGNPQNLVDPAILHDCRYITVPTTGAASADQLSYAVLLAAVSGVPTDRFVVSVTLPLLDDPTSDTGYFAGTDAAGERIYATRGAAEWVSTPASYTKAGISILDAQNDYFNISLVYKHIREAIDLMNPSPKN